MAQYNIDPPDYPRDTRLGTVLAVLLVLALVAFLVSSLAFGGFSSPTDLASGLTANPPAAAATPTNP